MAALLAVGFEQGNIPQIELPLDNYEPDEDTRIFERSLRAFARGAMEINENVFRKRLGQQASRFFDAIVPSLLEVGILQETDYRGHGKQKRLRLVSKMEDIDQALRRSQGQFEQLVAMFQIQPDRHI